MLESEGVLSPPEDGMVSTDELLEPEREVLRRFREEESPSSKGLGRVEQGSEETARSRGSDDLES